MNTLCEICQTSETGLNNLHDLATDWNVPKKAVHVHSHSFSSINSLVPPGQ